ncbi:hypothetical protein A2630_03945 [Candidatus Woesebacteria bacterium RIFCSPHIGHO2_01_FULL_44_10]|uniref:Peptidyl-tRNA hydrolase n=1 Tax=Candidatus Woesebacteria bacterium RIFCSPLOWO2_01_FULL_44_14 TaxID=1802525 RepID=A0A1F8C099_9BACT|nr:MAG: hypothetical protein A2630_03945 [Candidatus Woesebacteria bacterium RIFCSPHIGHO2_01_FULL_44_10]OGM55974.1 MAG: hypothetical protein A3F62_05365 [Candidatus Woesebacteria bacterium RIFCSPHIGHO2_12_FULL_44_11]OGM69774.1 MAG: hypothetical protein A2975_00250 [Candidatus Woesebacteria bacterium RIFCSPLOWO2_01_FULL_44_14]
MKLIVGLGNPGEKYRNNRHNVGHMVVDGLEKRKLPKNVVVKKTGVFMNNSGSVIRRLINRYSLTINYLYVIHDDLDINLGEYKIQKGKGPKDHKGLNSIYDALGSKDFWHVRIGVDNRDPQDRIPGEDYVLQNFNQEELDKVNVVIEEICKKLVTL